MTIDGEMLRNLSHNVHTNETIQNGALRILRTVGLTLGDLPGKSILDLGSGPRFLERKVNSDGINAKVVSYDIDFETLSKANDNKVSAVQGTIHEGLPFKFDAFDLVINVGGPLRGGPANSDVIEMYINAIKTLKENGEIRIYNPFRGVGGIAEYLYYLDRKGKLAIRREDIETVYYEEEPEYDDRGMPYPMYPGDDFWFHEYYKLPKEQQLAYSIDLTKLLEEELRHKGVNISLRLEEPDKDSKDYDPFLIIKRLITESK